MFPVANQMKSSSLSSSLGMSQDIHQVGVSSATSSTLSCGHMSQAADSHQ